MQRYVDFHGNRVAPPESLWPAFARLEDAHKLWHQAEANYFNPEEFRISLNACIQALRSVTFLLQKNKRQVHGFEPWYQGWQDRLRGDPIMRWSIEARNRVVKQGDLDLHSILRVGILASYFDPPYSQYSSSPASTTSQILEGLDTSHIPADILKHGYLRLERRWVAGDLQDHELLDLLAHCHSVLSLLLHDAWKLLDADPPRPELETGMLPCLIRSDDDRSVWISLATGSMEPVMSIPHEPEASREQVLARYGPLDASESLPDGSELTRLAHLLFRRARIMLQADKEHGFFVFLLTPGSQMRLLQLFPDSQGEKYRLWREVAAVVARIGATAAISISEVWLAPQDPDHPLRHAAQSPDRTEALALEALSKEGEQLSLIAPFRREGDQILLEETQEFEPIEANFFEPIRRVWASSGK